MVIFGYYWLNDLGYLLHWSLLLSAGGLKPGAGSPKTPLKPESKSFPKNTIVNSKSRLLLTDNLLAYNHLQRLENKLYALLDE
jgi:hypothetical protein